MTITELQEEAFNNSEAHGFHQPPPTFGDFIALIHSELSEALEEFRTADRHRFSGSIFYINGDKPEGIGIELADAMIRIADMAGVYDIDLEHMVKVKIMYNRSRPHRHGGKNL